MYLAKREVGALTKALRRCLARLVTSALKLHGDLRAGGLLDSFFGGFVEAVGVEAAEGRGRSLHRCTQPSEQRTCIPSTHTRIHTSHKACHGLSAVCALLMSGQFWDTAEVEQSPKASSSESERLRKRALDKASTSGSKHLCNQHFTVQSKQRACQQAGRRASKLKARIQQCTGVSKN